MASSQQTQATAAASKISIPLTYFDLCLMQISLSRQLKRATVGRHDSPEAHFTQLSLGFLPLFRLCSRLSMEAGHLRELAQANLATDVQSRVSFSLEEFDLLVAGLEQYRVDLLMEDARLGPAFTRTVGGTESHRLPPFSTDNGKLLRLAPLIARLCLLKAERSAHDTLQPTVVRVEPETRLIWHDRRSWSQVSLSQVVCPLFRDRGTANRYVVWCATPEGFACRRVGKQGVQSASRLYPSQRDAKAACEHHYLAETWE